MDIILGMTILDGDELVIQQDIIQLTGKIDHAGKRWWVSQAAGLQGNAH